MTQSSSPRKVRPERSAEPSTPKQDYSDEVTNEQRAKLEAMFKDLDDDGWVPLHDKPAW